MCHACRLQHVLGQVVGELFSRRALDHTTDNCVTVSAVLVLRARLEEQRVVGEDAESVAHSAVMPDAIHLPLFVMSDSRDVSEDLPSGHLPLLLRESGTVLLNRRVK